MDEIFSGRILDIKFHRYPYKGSRFVSCR